MQRIALAFFACVSLCANVAQANSINSTPVCDQAYASPDSLWSPNHKFEPVSIEGVFDPDGDSLTITPVCVMQDEPVDANGDGSTEPDAQGVGTSNLLLLAERAGQLNGRVYHVDFIAEDSSGAACIGEVLVKVPHNRKDTNIDEGRLYASTPDNINCTGELPNVAPTVEPVSANTLEDTLLNIALQGHDEDGDVLSYSLFGGPDHGQVNLSGNQVTYTPDTNFNGMDSFQYQANDGIVNSAPATVSITVLPVNDAPVAQPVSVTLDEDGQVAITLQGDDVDSDILTYQIASQPQHGTLSGNGPSLTYVPGTNYYGADSFTYSVNDGTETSSDGTVSITVQAVNDAPVAEPQQQEVNADITSSFFLQASDLEGDALTVELIQSPLHGSVTFDGLEASYAPATGYIGTDSFSYRVNDGADYSGETGVSLTVVSSNHAPVANTLRYPLQEDTSVSFYYEGTDVDGDVLEYEIVNPPSHGNIYQDPFLPEAGTMYFPDPNYYGEDFLEYRAFDGEKYSDVARIYFEVASVNDAPVAEDVDLLVEEDHSVSFTVDATDIEGGVVTQNITAGPQHGMLTQTGDMYLYIPDADFNGSDSFQIAVSDEAGLTTIVQGRVLVKSVNDVPMIQSTPYGYAAYEEPWYYAPVAYDADADADILHWSLVQAPEGMLIAPVTGQVFWTPVQDQKGFHTIELEVVDSQGATDSQIFVIEVAGGKNYAPIITFFPSGFVFAGEKYQYQVIAQDVDSDPVTYELIEAPDGMSISYMMGEVFWQPTLEQAGLHLIKIRAYDSQGAFAEQLWELKVEIDQNNQTPFFTSTPVINGQTGVLYMYQVGATDPDQDELSYSLESAPVGMSIDQSTGSTLWEPIKSGNYPVIIMVDDAKGGKVHQSFMLKIQDYLAPPVITSQPADRQVAYQGYPFTYTYQIVATDPDSQTLTYKIISSPSGATVDAATGLLSWTGDGSDYQYTERWTSCVNTGAELIIGGLSVNQATSEVGFSISNQGALAHTGGSVDVRFYNDEQFSLAHNFELGSVLPGSKKIFSLPVDASVVDGAVEVSINDDSNQDCLSTNNKRRFPLFRVEVLDDTGLSDEQFFSVSVINMKPYFLSDPVVSGDEVDGYFYQIETHEPSGTYLTAYMPSSTVGAVLDGTENKLSISADDVDQYLLPYREVDDYCTGPDIESQSNVILDGWFPISEAGQNGGIARWVVSDDGLQAQLSGNAPPSYFVSPFDVTAGSYRFSITPSGYDDDFIGLVWGLKDSQHYYRFRWDAGGGMVCPGGCVQVHKINSAEPLISSNSPSNELLYESSALPWHRGKKYDVIVDIKPSKFTFQIFDGDSLLNAFSIRDGLYEKGRIGFYTHSQSETQFSLSSLETNYFPDLVLGDIYYDEFVRNQDVYVDVINRGAATAPAGISIVGESYNKSGSFTVPTTYFNAVTSVDLKPGEKEKVYLGPLVLGRIDFYSREFALNIDPENQVQECRVGNNTASYPVFGLTVGSGTITDVQRYAASIRNIPEPFHIDPVDDQYAAVGRAYHFSPNLNDPDFGDNHQFELLDGPDRAAFTEETGVLYWYPQSSDLGKQYQVRLKVVDLAGFEEEIAFNLQAHQAPVISSTPIHTAYLNESYGYQVEASDPDGGALSYSLVTPVSGATIDPVTGWLEWSGYARYTLQTFRIEVKDDEGAVTGQAFKVGVRDRDTPNAEPQITSTPINAVNLNDDVEVQAYSYDVDAVDSDADSLLYLLSESPLGMKINTSSGEITWYATRNQVGQHYVTVSVYDYLGGSDTQSFIVDVIYDGANQAPVIDPIVDHSAYSLDPYSYQVNASDPEGAGLVFSLLSGPQGMAINPVSGHISWTPQAGQEGNYEVKIQAVDDLGGSTIVSYQLELLSTSNIQPVISSSPVSTIAIGDAYTYQIVASDPDGDTLSYSLLDGPAGMVVSEQGVLSFTPTTSLVGNHPVVVNVSDRRYSVQQSYTLTVTLSPDNEPPLFVTQPEESASVNSNYVYKFKALDPEEGQLSYELLSAPAGMWLNVRDGIAWQPNSFDLGVHEVLLQVADQQGNTALQGWRIQVYDNASPLITSTPADSVVQGYTYTYQLAANDPEGDRVYYVLQEGPPGMSMDSSGLVSWTPVYEDIGQHTVVVRGHDGVNYIDQTYTLHVDAIAQPLAVNLSVTPQYARLNDPIDILVEPVGGTQPYNVTAVVDGNPLTLTDGEAQVEFATIGNHTLDVSVVDGEGNTSTDRLTFAVSDGTDQQSPVVELASPTWNQEVTAPIDIVGSIDDSQLSEWLVVLKKPQSTDFEVLARGAGTVTDSVLATLDPTMLMNGLYEVVLQATDLSGQTASAGVIIEVDGNLKVGNFTVSFEDMNVPMLGIPIRVTRTYDSRRRNEALDFGQGWSIGYQDVLIDETSEPAFDWTQSQSPQLFILEGNQVVFDATCTRPVFDKQVAVTLPNGEVERFQVRAEAIGGGTQSESDPDCYLTASRYFNLVFEPDERTDSTLTADNTQSLYLSDVNGGDMTIDITESQGLPINQYTLTTRTGYVYELDQDFGIRTVTDPNGHSLTYTDGGIFHSAGKSVLFNRDGEGRITSITDPAGEVYNYEVNSLGDLISVTDPLQNQSTYTYHGRSHLLDDMFDGLGRRVVKNIYNEDNRLIAQEDSEGNRTDFNHDLDGRLSVVTDRRGNSTQFYYDDRGNVLRQIDANGHTTTYTYDDEDNQLSETNPLLEKSEATYNAQGDQLTQKDALGNVTSFEYNARGQETRIEDARGNAFINTYDTVGNLLSITDPQSNSASNSLLPNGLVLNTTDLSGNVTAYTYYADGNKKTETDAEGNVTSWTYDANGNVKTESVTREINGVQQTETTTFAYDALNRIVATTDPLGQVTRTEYDAAGNESASIDTAGKRTEYDYDAYGRLIETRYPDGTTERKSYDAEGNVIAETDRLGRTTAMGYDKLNRLIKTTYPDGTFTQTEYDAAGRATAEIDERGNRTEYEYDAAGRRSAVINAAGHRHSFDYDADGNLVSETDANGLTTEYEYNKLGQKTRTIHADGTSTSSVHDPLSRKLSDTDQAGVTTQYAYDALGRLTKVTDAAGGETTYTYDSRGNKLTQTDAEGRTTTWTYDALGRVTSRTLPMGQSETFEYDASGNVTRHVDFKGQVTTSQYNTMDRLIQRSYADGTVEGWTYDAAGRKTSASQTVNGVTKTTAYDYDVRDRLIREEKPDGSVLTYGYDAAGNKTSQTTETPDGNSGTTTYTYDRLNRLITVNAPSGTTTYSYDAAGNRKTLERPNGVTTTYTYDSVNRLTNQITKDATGAVLTSYSYTLDPTGRRTRIDEDSGRSSQYDYDSLYRLTSETITDTQNGDRTATYVYDAVGNRTQATVNGITTAYSYDGNDRLTQEGTASYSYDLNGNTVQKTEDGIVTSYNYDARNRLVEVIQPSGTLQYGYDSQGIRTSKTESGVTTSFVVDHNRQYAQVLAELENGVLSKTYTYGDDLVSQEAVGGQDSFYLYDGLGTTRGLTDGSGALSDEYYYEAFGELLASTGSTDNGYLFTGEQFDADLGQYYLRARYYDPGVGRFTQMDTWQGSPHQPITLNKYLYANSDPMTYVDPSGNVGIHQLTVATTIASILVNSAVTGYSIGRAISGGSVTPDGVIISFRGVTFGGKLGPVGVGAGVGLDAIYDRKKNKAIVYVAGDISASPFSPIFNKKKRGSQRSMDLSIGPIWNMKDPSQFGGSGLGGAASWPIRTLGLLCKAGAFRQAQIWGYACQSQKNIKNGRGLTVSFGVAGMNSGPAFMTVSSGSSMATGIYGWSVPLTEGPVVEAIEQLGREVSGYDGINGIIEKVSGFQ